MAVDLPDVKNYLGAQPSSAPVNDGVLQNALDAAIDRVTTRCMPQFVVLPDEWPEEVNQAVTMLAARLYRRRYSVGGFEGFGDLGIARVPALDPDIEDLLTRYVRYDFA